LSVLAVVEVAVVAVVAVVEVAEVPEAEVVVAVPVAAAVGVQSSRRQLETWRSR
jgi:hypothetical protein